MLSLRGPRRTQTAYHRRRTSCEEKRLHIVPVTLATYHAGALDEQTLTTNGTQLARYASALADCGVRRVNVSLDMIDPEKFGKVTRRGDLYRTLAGISAAQRPGVKINAVALSGLGIHDFKALIGWATTGTPMSVSSKYMPVGEVGEPRADQFMAPQHPGRTRPT